MKQDSSETPYQNPYGAPQAEILISPVATGDGEFPPWPWLTIWFRPRATMQRIVDSDPRRHVVLIMLLAGVVQGLQGVVNVQLSPLTESLSVAVPLSILFGVVGSLILGLLVGSILLSWAGLLIGGQGNTRNVRAAIAWASVPGIWGVLLFLARFAVFGLEAFALEPETTELGLVAIWSMIDSVAVVLAIWAFIIFLKCLGQVQGFSAWMALVSVILAGLALFVPVVGTAFVVVMILAW